MPPAGKVHSIRSWAICSLLRLPRFSPRASYTTGFQPMPTPQAQPATDEHVYLCTLFVDQGGLPLRKDQNPGNQLHYIGDGV